MSLRAQFHEDHERLGALCEELARAASPTASPADKASLLGLWAVFERAVRDHIRLEEAELLPLLEDHAADCRRARYEHDRIRDLISDLAALADAGGLVRQTLDQLASLLAMHSAWEEQSVYPLAEARLSASQSQRVARALGRRGAD